MSRNVGKYLPIRFGTTCRSHLQGSSSTLEEEIDRMLRNVGNYQPTLLKSRVIYSNRQFCTSASYHQPATLIVSVASRGRHRQPATEHRRLLCTNRHSVTVQNKNSHPHVVESLTPGQVMCVYFTADVQEAAGTHCATVPLSVTHYLWHTFLSIYSTTRA
jgi:hypothetical protein